MTEHFHVCFVKRTVPAGSKGTSWYLQDYTQHKVVVPGASRCLAKVAHQAGGYPQKVDCQPQPLPACAEPHSPQR
ncbi:hypothetical protein C7B04_16785 [Escherichia sp. 4726-5]|nr:hypothetical protein C7B04_16785 [Escherichia sp. 4726-5]